MRDDNHARPGKPPQRQRAANGPENPESEPARLEQGLSNTAMVMLWSSVGVVALACVGAASWLAVDFERTPAVLANERVDRAVMDAQAWLSKGGASGGEGIELQLRNSLSDKAATKTSEAQAALRKVVLRREELERAVLEQQAAATLKDATRHIDEKRISEAIALLKKYLADPNATQQADAQGLLSEAEQALSDALVIDALMSLSEPVFAKASSSGDLRSALLALPAFRGIHHPVLIAVLEEAAQRHIARVTTDRLARTAEQHRIAEERTKTSAQQNAKAEIQPPAQPAPAADGTILYKQIATFPEKYLGNDYYFRGALSGRYTRRNKDAKCFSISFTAENYKSPTLGGPYADQFSLVTTEEMGAHLVQFEDEYRCIVHVTVRYLDPARNLYPIGHVTKLELFTVGPGDIEDSVRTTRPVVPQLLCTLYDTGKVEKAALASVTSKDKKNDATPDGVVPKVHWDPVAWEASLERTLKFALEGNEAVQRELRKAKAAGKKLSPEAIAAARKANEMTKEFTKNGVAAITAGPLLVHPLAVGHVGRFFNSQTVVKVTAKGTLVHTAFPIRGTEMSWAFVLVCTQPKPGTDTGDETDFDGFWIVTESLGLAANGEPMFVVERFEDRSKK